MFKQTYFSVAGGKYINSRYNNTNWCEINMGSGTEDTGDTTTSSTSGMDLDTATFDAGVTSTTSVSGWVSDLAGMGSGVTTSQGTAAVGEGIGIAAPPMQRFTDEELRDCPVEECLTAQWDAGDPERGSFETSQMGTHYFITEPKEYSGELVLAEDLMEFEL